MDIPGRSHEHIHTHTHENTRQGHTYPLYQIGLLSRGVRDDQDKAWSVYEVLVVREGNSLSLKDAHYVALEGLIEPAEGVEHDGYCVCVCQ